MFRRSLTAVTVAASAVAIFTYATFAQQAAAPALDAEKLLPAGRTLAFVSIADWKTAEAAFGATDLGQVWKTLEPFKAELERGFDVSMSDIEKNFERDSGANLDDALALLRGGLAAGVVDMAIPEAANPAPAFVLVLPAQHKAIVEKVMKKMFAPPPGAPAGAEAPEPPVKLIEQGGRLLVVTDPGAVAAAGAKTLADDATFQSLKARMQGGGSSLILMYGNVEGLLARVQKKDPKTHENLDKAGATDAKALGISLGFADGRLREAIAVAAPGERHGLMKIISGAKPIDAAALARESPADCLSFGALRVDLRAALDEVLAWVKSMDAKGGEKLEQEIAKAKLDVRGLLAGLGDTIAMESAIPEDGLLPEATFVFQLRDPAKVEAALAQAAKMLKMEVKAVDRGGRKIKYFQAPLGKLGDDPTRGMGEEELGASIVFSTLVGCYAIDGQKLYVSALPQTLDDRFERLARGNLADAEAFKSSIGKGPQGARMVGWGKTRGTFGVLYHLGLRVFRALEPIARRAGVPIDTALLPRPGAFARPMLPMTSGIVVDADGIALVSQGGMPTLSLVPVIAAVAIPNLIEAKKKAEEAKVKATLRQFAMAQRLYKDQKGKFAETIQELVQAELLTGAAPMPGWEFVVARIGEESFAIEARPREGGRVLVIDQNMYARGADEPDPFATGEPEMPHHPVPPEGPETPGEGEAPPPPPPPGEGGQEGEGGKND